MEAINHGAVTVHQNRPVISVLLVCLHTGPKQENHTPIPAIIQCDVEFSAGSLEEWGRRNKEDKVHPHMLVVAPKRPAVDKLFAKEVFVSNVQAAEDLYLRPVATSPSTVADSLLHAPNQPSNVMLMKLIMLAIRCRQPEANELVATMVVQVTGQFLLKVLQN